jgi:hypothetical protein
VTHCDSQAIHHRGATGSTGKERYGASAAGLAGGHAGVLTSDSIAATEKIVFPARFIGPLSSANRMVSLSFRGRAGSIPAGPSVSQPARLRFIRSSRSASSKARRLKERRHEGGDPPLAAFPMIATFFACETIFHLASNRLQDRPLTRLTSKPLCVRGLRGPDPGPPPQIFRELRVIPPPEFRCASVSALQDSLPCRVLVIKAGGAGNYIQG